MRTIYIAGPYSAPNAWKREANIRAAEALSLQLWRAGVPAICVHSIARSFHGEVSESDAMAIDDELLRRCDAVLLAPGWSASAGTMHEMDLAQSLSMPVFADVNDCIEWAKEV